MSMAVCTEWAEESFEECAREEDRGYEACDAWDDECCDWWPCSWGCKLVTWICVGWTWVSNVVCVAWTAVSTLVCIAWTVIEVILIPIAWLINWITAIPIVGRLIDEILNLVQTIIWRVVGLIGTVFDVVGIRPLKKIRICIVVLRDRAGDETITRDGAGDPVALQAQIDAARQILRDEADIHLIVDGIHSVDGPSPVYALDVSCNLAAWGEDLWLPGTYYEATANWHCPFGTTSHITGYRSQIVVFCVRGIPGGTAGCALGPLNDYLTIEGGNPVCLAHEIGHKIGLWHCCPATNLANGICGGTRLEGWQVLIARNSKYVTYF